MVPAHPAREGLPVRRVVVPVEGSDREYLVQEHAVALAGALEVPLTAVHVQSATDGRNDVFAWLEKQAQGWGVELQTLTLQGQEPAAVLADELDAMDLVVIGSRRLGGRYHVGSVADRLIRDAPCPVQVVRLPG